MENKLNVYQKLNKIQTELRAPKGNYNSFGKYKYRSCEDVLEALKPLLAKYEAIVNMTDTIELIGDRYYIKATAIFIDAVSGEKVEVSAFAREDADKKGMDLSQLTGSVSSYSRKYALNGLFAIDDNKDADSTNTHGKDTSAQAETTVGNANSTQTQHNNSAFKCNDPNTNLKPSEAQTKRFWGILKSVQSKYPQTTKESVFAKYKEASNRDVSVSTMNLYDYERVCAWMENLTK